MNYGYPSILALRNENEPTESRPMTALTLELDERHTHALEALAAEQDMSKEAVMRQALRLYQMVHHRAKEGLELAFTRDGQVVAPQFSKQADLPPA